MGIEGFFNSIKKYSLITKLDKNNKLKKTKYLFLDFNSIIHNISQHVLKKIKKLMKDIIASINQGGNVKYDKFFDIIDKDIEDKEFKKEEDVYKYFKKYYDEKLEDLIIEHIQKYLIYMLKEKMDSSDLELFYISIDGAPSKAKTIQTRKRRFLADFMSQKNKEFLRKNMNTLNKDSTPINGLPYNLYKFHTNKISFNKSLISPATGFMINVSNALQSNSFIKQVLNVAPIIKKCNIIIDDYQNSGEGEHKILQYLEKHPQIDKNLSLYSPDADLINLMLNLTNIKNLNLMRFDQQSSKLGLTYDDLHVDALDINELRKTIIDYVLENLEDKKIDEKHIIKEVIILYNIFGNDFIPKLESINVRSDIKSLLKLYSNIKNRSMNLLEKDGDDYKLNFLTIKNLFRTLSFREESNLHKRRLMKTYNGINRIYGLIRKYVSFNKIDMKIYLNNVEEFVDKYNLYRKVDKLVKNKKDLTDKHFKSLKIKDKDEFLKNYMDASDMFSGISVDTFIVLDKREPTIKNKYNQKITKDFDLVEKEIYKFEKLLDEYHDEFLVNESVKLKDDVEEYKKKFSNEFLAEDASKFYLEGLVWVVDSYLNNKFNYSWFYPYYKAPFCNQISDYLHKGGKVKLSDEITYSPSPLELLLLVSPLKLDDMKKSLSILGDAYSDKLKDKISKTIKGMKFSDDLYFKKKFVLTCKNAQYFNHCMIDNEQDNFDLYDKFIMEFRKNIPLKEQIFKTQVGGGRFIKLYNDMRQYKEMYYVTRNIKYKKLYKGIKQLLNNS